MGVMSCSRRRCEQIMCNTYVNTTQFTGYVCNECQEEFKQYLIGIGKDPSDIPVGDLNRKLADFMETDKDSLTQGDGCSVDNFFDSYTRR